MIRNVAGWPVYELSLLKHTRCSSAHSPTVTYHSTCCRAIFQSSYFAGLMRLILPAFSRLSWLVSSPLVVSESYLPVQVGLPYPFTCGIHYLLYLTFVTAHVYVIIVIIEMLPWSHMALYYYDVIRSFGKFTLMLHFLRSCSFSFLPSRSKMVIRSNVRTSVHSYVVLQSSEYDVYDLVTFASDTLAWIVHYFVLEPASSKCKIIGSTHIYRPLFHHT